MACRWQADQAEPALVTTTYNILGVLVGEANNNFLTPRTRSEELCAKEKTRLTTFWQNSPILEAGLIPVHAVLVTLFYSSRVSGPINDPYRYGKVT